MIELSHIYKTFQAGTVNESVLFSDFNLSIHDDDFIAVIGSNGSGKDNHVKSLMRQSLSGSGSDHTRWKRYYKDERI